MVRRCFFSLAWIACAAAVVAAAQGSGSARDVVQRLQGALIGTMKDAATLDYAARYARLAPVIDETHRLDLVSRVVLGRHWSQLDPEKQKAFVAKFRELCIATYAAEFDSYSGEGFKVTGEEPLKQGKDQMLVRGALTRPNDKDVSFNYMLDQSDGQWKIINIIADGVSDLALKRAEYTSIIDREGFDALMNKLTQKIADYSHGVKK